jgi:hypothetical protein
MADERLDRIEQRISEIAQGQGGLRTGLDELGAGQGRLDARLTRVEILQEEMRDQIQIIAEGHAATQAAIARGIEAVKAHIDSRIDPLELALREHLGT